MIEEKLKNIFIEIFSLNPKISSKDIHIDKIQNWDSLKHISLIIAIEQTFEVEIMPDDFPKLFSDFKTIFDYLKVKNID